MQFKAQRLEDEIMTMQSDTNRHMLEERGLLNREERDETGLYTNEEMKYSGVVRPIGKFKCYKAVAKKGGISAMNDAILANLHSDSFILERAPVVEKPKVLTSSSRVFEAPSTQSRVFDASNIKEFRPETASFVPNPNYQPQYQSAPQQHN